MGSVDFEDIGWLSAEARSLLRAANQVVPVVGAGIAKGAGLPDAPELEAMIRALPKIAGLGLSKASLSETVNTVIERRAVEEVELVAWVVDQLSLEGRTYTTTETLRSLAHASSRLVITLNYDLLIEDVAHQYGNHVRTLTLNEADFPEAIDAVVGRCDDELLRVLHIHGAVTTPEDMVLSSRSYRALKGRVRTFLPHLYANRTICFMGTRLDEAYLLDLLEDLRLLRATPAHLLVTDEANATAITQERAPVSVSGHGIRVEFFETGAWDALDAFAPSLARQLGPIEPHPFAVATSIPIDVQYVSNIFVASGDDDTEDYVDALLAEAGLRATFTEDELAQRGRRTVIVGVPGSGKSSALREIGRRAPPAEHPIVVSLARISTVGEPETLLTSWASAGESLRDSPPVGNDALQDLRFHFLLDSLDEVPPGHQERVARAINRVAAAFPQHRFTVASRKVAALGVLEEEVWDRLVLSPGPEWRERFLAAEHVSWEELLATVPALRDLHELLRLPFFVRRVVELWRLGELDGLSNIWSLIARIVDRAIRAEEIGFPEGPLREWLRKIAFAMQLAGRTSISVAELGSIAMPLALADYGTSEEIAERLVATPLLHQPAPESYSFIHRLIGEWLVAEELIEIGPVDEALDVVAPMVSDRIGGLREDWGVSVSLAASRDKAWRDALSSRDDLASARAVPVAADADERLTAGQLIWRRYAEWEIWLFNADHPDFMEAGQAIVRFLQAGEADVLLEEIVSGLGSPSPFVRGNALQIIGRAQLDVIDDGELARFITDDPNPVVRRDAAIAAERLGRTALWTTIVDRLESVSDEVEAQDLTIAAGELGSDEQLLELAVRVAGSKHAFVLEHRLEKRLGAMDLLRILRERASREDYVLTSGSERLNRVVGQLDPSDADVARMVGFIAAAWRSRDTEVLNLLRANPKVAAEGMYEATSSGAAYDFDIAQFTDVVDAESIRAAGFDDHVVAWFEPPPPAVP